MVPDLTDHSLARLVSLSGRSGLITGAARGIGHAIARRLAEAGADLLLGDLNEQGVAQTAEMARGFGVRAFACALDMAEPQSVAAFAERGVREFGRIDIWINNAGVFPSSPLLDMTIEEWDWVDRVNLRGTFLGCREAGKRMVAARRGVIINIASIAAVRGRASLAHYTAAKHGVIGLTKAAAAELGGSGVRVLAVAPTLTETPGVRQLREQISRGAPSGPNFNAIEDQVRSSIPLGRLGLPDDVARVVLFCASDLASFVTGTTVFADGGVSAV